MRPTLFYAYDPLCGWCYGFHPSMEKLANRFGDDLDIEVIAGGLAIGENAQTIAEGFDYIPGASKQVETVTGVSFGEPFYLIAEEGSYVYDSEASCIAQTVINQLAPEHALIFAGMMQNSIFKFGKSLNEWETFSELFSELSVDIYEAKKLFDSESIKQKTYQGFEWCRKAGASAFPTLLLKIGNDFGVMSRGYRPFDTLESHLHHLLNNIKKISTKAK
jgi:putative protein-disulfide isomerase